MELGFAVGRRESQRIRDDAFGLPSRLALLGVVEWRSLWARSEHLNQCGGCAAGCLALEGQIHPTGGSTRGGHE